MDFPPDISLCNICLIANSIICGFFFSHGQNYRIGIRLNHKKTNTQRYAKIRDLPYEEILLMSQGPFHQRFVK